jgi:hypothetical protein
VHRHHVELFVNMAAAVPLSTFSGLYGDASLWANPTPDYATLAANFGAVQGAVPSVSTACREGLSQASSLSPLVVAFVSAGECDTIYVAHSLSVIPSDVTNPTAVDGHLMGVVGNEPSSAYSVVFPHVGFTVTGAIPAEFCSTFVTHHGLAPPMFRSGPHAAGTANTSAIRGRPVMVLPAEASAFALQTATRQGNYTLLGFFDAFIRGAYDGSPAQRAAIRPLANWWRLACTDRAVGGDTEASIALTPTASPALAAKVAAHLDRVKTTQKARMGLGGPGLTTTAFAHGIAEVRTTLENNLAQQLAHETARRVKTFTDFHGGALAATMHRLCGVTSDADLPPIHNLLVRTTKSQQYSVLGAAFTERTASTVLHLAPTHSPVVTVGLMDQVFRSFRLGGEGLEFAKGLTPFALICPGHSEANNASTAASRASQLESGASATLADLTALASTDPLFPVQAFVAAEKLYAWSVVVDVFHGINHPVAASVRNAVHLICPCLQRIATLTADTAGVGMELICRIMYELQQDYFSWVNKASTEPITPTAPTFERIVFAATTYRAATLAPLPNHWYAMLSSPGSVPVAPGAVAPAAPPAAARPAASTLITNPHADARIKQRFADTGFGTITELIAGRSIEYPKWNGKPLCAAWILKGQCTSACKRAAQHTRPNAGINKAAHDFLNACGVPNPPN